jgi:hypothetical protein
MSGFAYNLPEGTVLTITIEGKTWYTETDITGSWRSTVILPTKEGNYTIKVEGGGADSEVVIDVKDAPKEKFSMSESLAFFLIALFLLVVLMIGYVVWRRNRDREFETDDWEEE